MHPWVRLAVLIQALFLSGGFVAHAAESQHSVYFEGSDHALHVYDIRGMQDGPTLLIIGGMHNEPGGYLAADLYADVSLERGNLIVVPRANLLAIVNNQRGVHGDMNRKFGSKPKASKDDYEQAVVEILKQLIKRSDVLLNLHDGWGFYRSDFTDKMHGPKRWGQAIITDTSKFISRRDKRQRDLSARVERVLQRVNPAIRNREHRFLHKNTHTDRPDSIHREQLYSATFYAVNVEGIESYGVETSKNIHSLDAKVRYQSLIINAFMDDLGITLLAPKVAVIPPQLKYLLVSVNDGLPYGIPDAYTLKLKSGDRFTIKHIAANYERGLIADVLGVGGINDLGKSFTLDKSVTIRVKKDQYVAGKIRLLIDDDDGTSPANEPSAPQWVERAFIVEVDGQRQTVLPGSELAIGRRQSLKLIGYRSSFNEEQWPKINFVGFVGNSRKNDADDRGYSIKTRRLLKRFSVNKQGERYRVEALDGERVLARMQVRYAAVKSIN